MTQTDFAPAHQSPMHQSPLHQSLVNLQSQLQLAQQQESDLREERDVCDMQFRAMNAHLDRITIRPQDMEDYDAVLRKRERVSDEWRVASRQLITLQRRLYAAGLNEMGIAAFNN